MNSNRPRIPAFFFAIGIGLSLLMAGLKAIVAGLAERYLYSVPFVGGFLRSIELAEISNWVVFALLAGGIGAATFFAASQLEQLGENSIAASGQPLCI